MKHTQDLLNHPSNTASAKFCFNHLAIKKQSKIKPKVGNMWATLSNVSPGHLKTFVGLKYRLPAILSQNCVGMPS